MKLVKWLAAIVLGGIFLYAAWIGVALFRLPPVAGLADRKGRVAPGYDADLVVWDPDAEWTVEPDRLQQRHKLTPYAGRRLRGTRAGAASSRSGWYRPP